MQQQRQQHRQLQISCIVPVFNEAEGIKQFLRALAHALHAISDNVDIIMVDDGSQDDSVAQATTLLSIIPLKIICLSRNFGKEMALAAGLQQSTAELTILIDADFQHPLEMVAIFVEKWVAGYDMVYGIQRNRPSEKYPKKFLSHVFYRVMNIFSKINIPNNAGDFRLLDAKVVSALNQCNERNRFMKGLYSWVGFKSIGIPFEAPHRKTGKSSWQFRRLFSLALTGLISFSDIPLRVWGLVGFMISSLSFTYGVCVMLDTWWYGVDVPGYATIIVAIMFFGGIQLLSIGILGEYIARIFNEVKLRPPYIIANVYEKINKND